MGSSCSAQVEYRLNYVPQETIMREFPLFRTPLLMAVAIGLAGPAALPAQAQSANNNRRVVYEYDGKAYETLAQCQRAKERAKKRGAVAGAVIAGAGAALLGGNLGESALVAGAGALTGREIGRATARKC
jgi:hypothetical protein